MISKPISSRLTWLIEQLKKKKNPSNGLKNYLESDAESIEWNPIL